MGTMQSFRFVGLPREIRDEIYGYYLFPEGNRSQLAITTLDDDNCSQPKPCSCCWSIETSLFRTSSWISEEARRYFYSHCHFESEMDDHGEHCFTLVMRFQY